LFNSKAQIDWQVAIMTGSSLFRTLSQTTEVESFMRYYCVPMPSAGPLHTFSKTRFGLVFHCLQYFVPHSTTHKHLTLRGSYVSGSL